MPKGEKFIDPKDIESYGQYWADTAWPRREIPPEKIQKRMLEHPDPNVRKYYQDHPATEERDFKFYIASRIEDADLEDNSIAYLHGESFLTGFIAQRIAQLKKGEKVKVLDLGGGSGAYAEQIRKEFGNSVKVYTTGLRKEMAKLIRKRPQEYGLAVSSLAESLIKNKRLSKDDLKWRSIRQLSDYPEFDLILSTYGENMYEAGGDRKDDLKILELEIKKLKVNGLLSISPLTPDSKTYVDFLCLDLEEKFDDCSLVFDWVEIKDFEDPRKIKWCCLKVKKLAKEEKSL